jgi:hypothetical protein
LDLDNVNNENDENAAHLKLKLRKNFSNYFKLSLGDYFITKFDEDFTPNLGTTKSNGYNSNITASFYTEADILFSKKLAAKSGLRALTMIYLKKVLFHHEFQCIQSV